MSETKGRSELQGVYGALLGGLMAVFVASAVFWAFLDPSGEMGTDSLLVAVLVGIGCAIAFMVGGLYATERQPWLGTSLFFASGFTTLCTVPASFGAEPRWAVLLAFGIAIATGVVIGSRRFGREKPPISSAGGQGRGPSVWVTQLVWGVGAAVLSSMLGMMCMTLAAVLAMALEAGATRSMGVAINYAALGLMIALYCAALVAGLRYLLGRYDVSRTVWPGLAAAPLVWGILMATSRPGVYEATPLLVSGAGLVVAWFVVGRRGTRRPDPMTDEAKEVAWTH